jgi:glutathione S-transferase
MTMRLYYNPFSPNARRALMTAIHLNVNVERVVVDLRKGEQKRPEYLKLNPNGKVPTLDDDGFILWESRAIMQYLAEKTPGQTIYPQEVHARADVNHWMFWDAVHLSPALGIIIFERLVKGLLGAGAADAKEVERGEKQLAPLMPVLDAQLATRAFVCGNTVTIADFTLAAPLIFAERAQISLPAHVAAWFQRVAAIDAYMQTVPQLP